MLHCIVSLINKYVLNKKERKEKKEKTETRKEKGKDIKEEKRSLIL